MSPPQTASGLPTAPVASMGTSETPAPKPTSTAAATVGTTVSGPGLQRAVSRKRARPKANEETESTPAAATSSGEGQASEGSTTDVISAVKESTEPLAQTLVDATQAAIAAVTDGTAASPAPKRTRTNTPWTPQEEQRLKQMRDAGNSWSEIAKTFPFRTEGSVKKHWYKDMHYAEFCEDESKQLQQAIKEYDSNKWKVVGAKLGKPAKACEAYAKEHFSGRN